MKKATLFIIALTLTLSVQAQKFGYIDTQVIIEKMPEYKEAQASLDKLSAGWAKEIEKMKGEIEKMELEYKSEELLLTDDMKTERLKVINEKKDELREFQNNHFGFEGLLFIKRKELIKPLQDKIGKAAATVAKKKRLQFLFDKASDITMIYSDPRYNYTDFVLEELELGDPADTPR